MSRKRKIGICCICGNEGLLSFEHVPPRAAFNKGPQRIAKGKDILANVGNINLEEINTCIEQRGTGGYTLCPRCNNNTGGWYGKAFINWTYQAAGILKYTEGKPSIYYQYHIFPLRVIKQILCQFFSANGNTFRNYHPNLEKFVLNKHKRHLGPSIKIYCYYNPTMVARQTGVAKYLQIYGNIEIVSEISYFPMAYIMGIENYSPSRPLFDISFFSNYSYNDQVELSLRIPVYSIHTYLPGDFRSKKEVMEDISKR